MTKKSRLFVVSGPYGDGRRLTRSLERICPGRRIQSLVTYHCRDPRPGEVDGVDHRFRSRAEIELLASRPGFRIFESACGLQGVKLDEISALLEEGDVLFEGDVHIALALAALQELERNCVIDVFVSPVSHRDVVELRRSRPGFEDRFRTLMRHRLLGRLDRVKPYVSSADLAEVERRSRAAFHALTHAHQFAHVIPRCDALLAGRVRDCRCVAGKDFDWLRAGTAPAVFETWPRDLLPRPSCP